ncbi:MAG: sulfatase-like hydrolase/transferase [Chlorobi bacterium]|nr:sulfatase-like hydrolase/transferase [Chlorobiota bacterium]
MLQKTLYYAKKFFHAVPASFRDSIAALGVLMVLYSVLRLGFYLVNRDFFIDVPSSELLAAFWHGLRFDLSALILVNVPVLVLYNIPGSLSRQRWYRTVIFVLFCLINIIGFLLNIADYGYYPMIQRRLLYEPYTMLPDLLRMAPGVLVRYWPLTLAFVLLSSAFVLVFARLFSRLHRVPENTNWKRSLVALAVLVILSVVGIRGGLQLKPIRQANAFFSTHLSVGYLCLNSTYTVFRSLFQKKLPGIHLLPEAEVRREITHMVRQADETMLDSEYVFLREKKPVEAPRRFNVVVFIMENWTAEYISAISGRPTVTPFFDSLAAGGALFTNFFADGRRSIEAVPSVLASVPGLYDVSIIGSKAEMDKFRGLGSILLEFGYTTSFHHGARTGSMGFDGFARLAGFMNYYGREDFPTVSDSVDDGMWGIIDEPFFLDAARRMDGFGKPFCSAIFSLSSHDPYYIPPHRQQSIPKVPGESEFERSMRYSDFSLGQFFRYARSRPWFDSTIFVITGDHTLFTARNNMYSSFHVPCLVYCPALVPPQVIPEVGQHVDILPTILDLLRLHVRHASMGRSLLDKDGPRYAFEKFGPEYAVFSDQFVLVNNLERDAGLFAYLEDPFYRHNLLEEYPDRANALRRILFAYVQAVTTAMAEDRVYR